MEIGGFSENHASQACQVSKGFGRLPCPATITSGQPILEAPKEKGTGKAQTTPAPLPKITSGRRGRCARALPPSRMVYRTLVEFDGLAPLSGFQAPPNRSEEETERRPRREDAKHCDHFHQSLLSCSVRATYYPSVRSPQSRPPFEHPFGRYLGWTRAADEASAPSHLQVLYLPAQFSRGMRDEVGFWCRVATERLLPLGDVVVSRTQQPIVQRPARAEVFQLRRRFYTVSSNEASRPDARAWTWQAGRRQRSRLCDSRKAHHAPFSSSPSQTSAPTW